jgi:hypothetical protein
LEMMPPGDNFALTLLINQMTGISGSRGFWTSRDAGHLVLLSPFFGLSVVV